MRSIPYLIGFVSLLLSLVPHSASAQNCSSSSQCDDGVFCNGRETCEFIQGTPFGACFAGTPPDCDDGIACTLDVCDHVADKCVNPAPDVDMDGVRDAQCLDGDGVPLGQDCNDNDENRFPGNLEVCDTEDHDEDCNRNTFGFRDGDGDTFPDGACCNLAGFAPDGSGGFDPVFECGSDCDDANPDVHPNIPEVCNGVDDNCRNGVDEGLLVDLYRDVDGDGHGDPSDVTLECPGTPGRSPLGNDCDDENPAVRPGTLICDKDPGSVLLCESVGTWAPDSCDLQTGEQCVTQPNGTGVCQAASATVSDLDADGIADVLDNCPAVHNSGQGDADENGFGDACECGDVTGDGMVNIIDARLIQRLAVGKLEATDLTCAARP